MWPMRSAASRGSRLPMIRRRPSCRWPLPTLAPPPDEVVYLSQPAIVFERSRGSAATADSGVLPAAAPPEYVVLEPPPPPIGAFFCRCRCCAMA